jgi:hypothetical protein
MTHAFHGLSPGFKVVEEEIPLLIQSDNTPESLRIFGHESIARKWIPWGGETTSRTLDGNEGEFMNLRSNKPPLHRARLEIERAPSNLSRGRSGRRACDRYTELVVNASPDYSRAEVAADDTGVRSME